MAFTHGMDVEFVKGSGGRLQSQAEEIRSLITRINSEVQDLAAHWAGSDATMFVTQWWPEHQAHLSQAADSVYGLGQSAINNATEQEGVSDH